MGQTVSDFVINRLADWGIDRIFGYPGDGINGFIGALDRHKDRVRFIQVRHEEMAAFMACAHSKFTGEVGICMATSGPGAIHLLNGLYDAAMDHRGVVAIVGQQATIGLGASYQQEVDLTTLFKDVAHEYVELCSTPEQARHLVDRAVRIAAAEQTVTCIIFPIDVQEMDAVESPPRVHGATFSGIGWTAPRVIPRDEDIRRAADVLNAGERVAIWSAPARSTPPTRSWKRPSAWARASPRPSSERPSSPTTSLTSPARSVCWAPSRAGI